MRRAPLIAILSAGVAGAVVAAAGCSGDGTCPDPGADGAADAARDATGSEATVGTDAPDTVRDAQTPRFSLDATTPVTSIRLANWSADAPAVDFCVGPHGTNHFEGPLVGAAVAALGDGGLLLDAGGALLGFPNASAYLPITSGNYDARVVVAGSSDCSVGIIPDLTTLPRLLPGESVTIALVGATQPQGLEPSLRMVLFLDDTGIPNNVALRVINAAVDLPLIDFGVGQTFRAPFLGIPFAGASEGPDASTLDASAEASPPEASVPEAPTVGDASADAARGDAAPPGPPPVVDPNGYFPETLSGVTLTARATGSATPVAVATNVSIAPGAVVTMAVLGFTVPAVDGGASAQILECVDNAGNLGVQGNCSILPP